MTAPPARRGKQRVKRATPAGIHMPGPSWAPVFGGVGLFLRLLGLVFGGVTLILGVIALALTLLYWLAEGLRIYDRDTGETTITPLPVEAHDGPPPGVHMPGPSWRPFLGALGMFALFLGPGVRWLAPGRRRHRPDRDAGRLAGRRGRRVPPDRRGRSDRSSRQRRSPGHALAAADRADRPDPRRRGPPVGHLRDRARERRHRTPGASGAPPPSRAAAGRTAPASGGPPPASGPARGRDASRRRASPSPRRPGRPPPAGRSPSRFPTRTRTRPTTSSSRIRPTPSRWRGDVFNGVETRAYQVPALPAGTYPFVCTVHPTMTGTATLQ